MTRLTLSPCSSLQPDTYFDDHFDEIQRLCFGIAIKWTKRPRALEVEDLVQEALPKIWKALLVYDKTKPMKPFIRKVACNAFKDACDTYGKLKTRSLEESLSTAEMSTSSATDSLTISTESIFIKLSPRQKMIIERRYGVDYQLGFDEIAKELGVTRQTVSSDHKKALKEIESKLRQRKTPKMAL